MSFILILCSSYIIAMLNLPE